VLVESNSFTVLHDRAKVLMSKVPKRTPFTPNPLK